MKERKLHLKKKLIKQIETEELDFLLQDEFLKDCGEDEWVSLIVVDEDDEVVYEPEGHLVKVDTILDIISMMKAKGATHLKMDYHVDHITYLISGYKLELANQENVLAAEQKRRKEELELKRRRIEEELRAVDQQLTAF